jgi:hypothetical protein
VNNRKCFKFNLSSKQSRDNNLSRKILLVKSHSTRERNTPRKNMVGGLGRENPKIEVERSQERGGQERGDQETGDQEREERIGPERETGKIEGGVSRRKEVGTGGEQGGDDFNQY